MSRRWLILALLLSLGINAGLVGTAWLRHRAHDERFAERRLFEREPGARLAEHLGLDGDARDQFLAAQRTLGRQVREIRPRVAGLERDVRRELVSKSPDLARIETLQREIAEQNLALDRAFATSVVESRRVLGGRGERIYLRFVEHFPRPDQAGGPPHDLERPRAGGSERRRGESQLGPRPGGSGRP